MRKLIKNIIIASIINGGVFILTYNVLKSFLLAIIFFSFLTIVIMVKPMLLILNKLTMRTNWYKLKYGDALKFRNIATNLDVCNLGSNSGKYAFSYDNTGLNGVNWALSPQTLSYDFRILKNYFSYLKEGATVLLPLCPLSGCIKDFTDDKNNHKYYPFLHPILIMNYSQSTYDRIMYFINKPFQASPIKALIRIFNDLPPINYRIIKPEDMEEDANEFVDMWKKQFLLTDLDAPISDTNKESIQYNIVLLNDIIDFCLERNLKPVVVIPPMSYELSSKLSGTFRENYIYSFIDKVVKDKVQFLNYLDEKKFNNFELYFNSYYLNTKGSEIFTRQVLNDLGLLK